MSQETEPVPETTTLERAIEEATRAVAVQASHLENLEAGKPSASREQVAWIAICGRHCSIIAAGSGLRAMPSCCARPISGPMSLSLTMRLASW